MFRSVINKHGDINWRMPCEDTVVGAIPMGDLHGHMARAACG